MRNERSFPCPKAKGSALMLILIILGLATALLVSALKSNPQIERDKITADALAKAKDALIGYAITYGDTHTSQVHGYMPCPDQNGTAGANGEGSSETCDSKNISVLGRLPWKTLSLSPLRDGSSECLWYAVAGTYKNNPMTDLMNWDSNGLLEVRDAGGATIAQNVVAVVFAPGAAIKGQNRAPDNTAPICGGNYIAANYLDNDTIHGINNSTVSSTANTVSQFIAGLVKDEAENTIVNDRVIFITVDDIFRAIKKRKDFGAFVSTLLATSTTCLSALPEPVTINFDTMIETPGLTFPGLVTGRMPYTSCADNSVRRWRDNLLYAKCTAGGNCLTVNGASCKGVVIFTGERSNATVPAQIRGSNEQKNTWNNYLEGTVLSAFTDGSIGFSGASAYSPASPSADVLACIGAPPPPPIVGGTPITLDATTITAACSGVCESSGIDTGVTTLALAGTPALTITATGGTIGRNKGGAATDAIGVYGGSGGAPDTALQSGESLSFRLTGNTAQKFGITLYDFDTGEQALLTFKNNGTVVGTYTATTATTANINPGGTFDEVVVQAIGAAAFWIQTVKFCDAATSC